MASQDEKKKRKRETRTPTMTRRKLSMKSFISGISVDDTLSSFLHGFNVFSFSFSLSFSRFQLAMRPRAHFAVISLGCRGDVVPRNLSQLCRFTWKFPRHSHIVAEQSLDGWETDYDSYTLILNNDSRRGASKSHRPRRRNAWWCTTIPYMCDVFS